MSKKFKASDIFISIISIRCKRYTQNQCGGTMEEIERRISSMDKKDIPPVGTKKSELVLTISRKLRAGDIYPFEYEKTMERVNDVIDKLAPVYGWENNV